MADTIHIKRGAAASNMPYLLDGEMAYVREEQAIYIGDEGTNRKIASALDADILRGKLTAVPAAAQADLAADADMAAIIASYNALLAALRAAGIMTTD